MCFQEQLAVPFLLASTNGEASTPVAGWGDQLEIPALERRFFHHGITDCYAAIRDWWRVNRGTLLPQFNRGWEWWLQNKNLYIEGFPKAGFRRMNEDEIADAKAGDVILFNVRSKVPNHGGVYLGNGLMYHHATQRQPYEPTKLATTEPVARWMNFQPIWLRRDEDDQSIRKAG
jgi:cell wall-associated NlpC family hydrolase